MGFYLLLLVVTLSVHTVSSSCIESTLAVYVTDEGHIRGKFLGLEDPHDKEMLTSCGLKCGCVNNILLCCSTVECIQMDRQCSQTHQDPFVPSEVIDFQDEPRGQTLDRRSILLDRLLSGRVETMRRGRRGAYDVTSYPETTTQGMTSVEVTEAATRPTEVATTQVEDQKGGSEVKTNYVVEKVGIGEKVQNRMRRSLGDEKVHVVKREEEYMEDALFATFESQGDSGNQNLDRKKRSLGEEKVHVVKRGDEEEYMEDALFAKAKAADSGNQNSGRKKRSLRDEEVKVVKRGDDEEYMEDALFAKAKANVSGNQNSDRKKRSLGDEKVHVVKRGDEEYMEDALFAKAKSDVSGNQNSDRKKRSLGDEKVHLAAQRKKRAILDEMDLTTEFTTTEFEVHVDIVTDAPQR